MVAAAAPRLVCVELVMSFEGLQRRLHSQVSAGIQQAEVEWVVHAVVYHDERQAEQHEIPVEEWRKVGSESNPRVVVADAQMGSGNTKQCEVRRAWI